MRLLELKEISAQIGLPLDRPPLLITYHAVTREPGDTPHQISELLSALSAVDSPMIFTYPNSDTGSTAIIESIRQFVDGRAHCRFLQNLGTSLYFSVMKHAAAMVGNSSSGIIEAASFRLPVVDIGSRQRGRTCGANVIHAEPDRQSIEAAIRRALSRKFRDGLRDLRNPYGDGLAAERIVEVLLQPTPTRTLICKKFMNLPAS
jgi:UDP-hydrolysing UDP-N-acetyl-D-glucosamine 2-epimerase